MRTFLIKLFPLRRWECQSQKLLNAIHQRDIFYEAIFYLGMLKTVKT